MCGVGEGWRVVGRGEKGYIKGSDWRGRERVHM